MRLVDFPLLSVPCRSVPVGSATPKLKLNQKPESRQIAQCDCFCSTKQRITGPQAMSQANGSPPLGTVDEYLLQSSQLSQ